MILIFVLPSHHICDTCMKVLQEIYFMYLGNIGVHCIFKTLSFQQNAFFFSMILSFSFQIFFILHIKQTQKFMCTFTSLSLTSSTSRCRVCRPTMEDKR